MKVIKAIVIKLMVMFIMLDILVKLIKLGMLVKLLGMLVKLLGIKLIVVYQIYHLAIRKLLLLLFKF